MYINPETKKRSDTIPPYVEALRQAIAGHPLPFLIGRQWAHGGKVATNFEEFDSRRCQAWDLVHASAYEALGPILADLISDLEEATQASEGFLKISMLEVLSDVYQIACAMLVKVGDHGGAWVASDRSISAADKCGNRNLVIAGHLRMARSMLKLNDRELARHVLIQAMDITDDALASLDPGLISLVGSCTLLLAVIDAREQNESARDHLVIAKRLAGAQGEDLNEYGNEFGPTYVAMHEVSVEVELGNGKEAIKLSALVPKGRLSPERQARFLIDVARAHILTSSLVEACLTLHEAEEIAPREVAAHYMAKEVIKDIEDRAVAGDRIADLLEVLKARING